MPDNDPEGEEGFKELLWRLHEHDAIMPRLGWSRKMLDGIFDDRQPESVTVEEWEGLCERMA